MTRGEAGVRPGPPLHHCGIGSRRRIGVHDVLGPDAVEIGYWCHVDHTGRKVISTSARELTRILLDLTHISRVEIHCDEADLRSAAVPKRLGYHFDRIEEDGVAAPAESGHGMVWIKERREVPVPTYATALGRR